MPHSSHRQPGLQGQLRLSRSSCQYASRQKSPRTAARTLDNGARANSSHDSFRAAMTLAISLPSMSEPAHRWSARPAKFNFGFGAGLRFHPRQGIVISSRSHDDESMQILTHVMSFLSADRMNRSIPHSLAADVARDASKTRYLQMQSNRSDRMNSPGPPRFEESRYSESYNHGLVQRP